jgi:diguanylate cyclase (GGDEF)-like protein
MLFLEPDDTTTKLSYFNLFDASQKLLLKQSGLGAELLSIVEDNKLQTVFQSIVDLKAKRVCAFEGLIRGPFNSVLHHPLHLFKVAEEQGVLYEMDTYARIASIESFARQAKDRDHIHLFLNASINAVMNSSHQKGLTLETLDLFGLPPERVVIEITELQPVDNFEAFISAINYYRAAGFKVAIDDLGSGYNGLRIWSEVRPDFVKVDRHFVSDIHLHEDKKAFMETILTLANSTGTRVVAEGVETHQELEVLQSLGVELVQGFLFKKPEAVISEELLYEWPHDILQHKADKREANVSGIAFQHPTVAPDLLVDEVSEQFLKYPEIDFFPVVKGSKICGMIWRRDLMDLLARKFGQELHSRKKIKKIMDSAPIIVDANTSLVDLSRLITDSNEFDYRDAFIIQSDDQYIGCGDFKHLLRKMTDLKVEMAQHSNPLSGLPGNLPIQKKLNKLLKHKQPFMVMYIDVDNFKAYNDNYSFDEGDQIISLIAAILNETIPEEHLVHDDCFIGHIGGDDFVIMSTHCDKYEQWANRILDNFKIQVLPLYSSEDVARGGIDSVDRNGDHKFFPLMTLSIGVLLVEPGLFEHRQQLSSFATKAKKGAKSAGGNTYYVVDSKTLN